MDTVTITDFWLNFLIASGLPAIVALVKSRYASKAVGAVLLAALSALTVLVQELLESTDWDWKALLSRFFVTFITAVAIHFGFLKPVGVTGNNGGIERAVPGGVGGRHARDDDDVRVTD